MTLQRMALLIVVLVLILGLAGCGGPGSVSTLAPAPQPNAVIFALTPPTSLAINASTTLSAAATYPLASVQGNAQVTWSVSCSTTNACGSFSTNADLGAITYTAPSVIPSGGTVTVKATSVVDTTKSISTTITIVPPIPISVSFAAAPPASLQVNSTYSFSAIVANDVSANPQLNWSASCGSAACGTFSPATTYNYAATTYRAPTTIPSGGSITVTATSATDSTKSVSAAIVITPAAPTLADGSYVFQVTGLDGDQASFTTGAFVASNGVIQSGEQDVTDYMNDCPGNNNSWCAYSLMETITGGSYASAADGNLQISLEVGPDEVYTLTGTLAPGQQGFVAGLNGAPASGTVELQGSTAAPSGGYAISLFGGDQYMASARIGGVLNVDSAGGISGAGSILDVIDSPEGLTGSHAVGASTVSAPDAYGRVTFTLLPDASSTFSPLYLTGYVVDASRIRLAETGQINDITNFRGVLGGVALGQGAATGLFNNHTIAGSSYVFGAQGSDAHGPLQLAGVASFQSGGNVTGLLNWNDLSGNAVQSPTAFTGTYSVDSDGRVTLSNLTDGDSFNYSLHLYLAENGKGLVLSNDRDDTFTGEVFRQQNELFSAASFSGSYGLNATVYTSGSYGGQQATTSAGTFSSQVASGSNAVSGFAALEGVPSDFALTGVFTPSANGVFTGTLAGFNPSARTTASPFSLYLIDGTQGVLIESDNTQLVLGHAQHE